MRLKTYLVVIFLIIAFSANIPAFAFQSTGSNESSLSFENIPKQQQEISDPETNNYPLKNWMDAESLYWQEKNKNDYISSLFLEKESSDSDIAINSKLNYDYYSDQYIINIDVDKLFYQPGDTVNYVIQVSQNLKPVSNYVMNVNVYDNNDNFFYQYGGYYYRYRDITPFKSFTISTNSEGVYTGSFTVAGAGQYSMFVSSDSLESTRYYYGPSAYRTISVSGLAIYSRLPYYYIPSQPITGYSIILEGDTFTPLSDVTVNITYYTFNWEQESPVLETSWEAFTDSNGKVSYSIPTDFTSNYWGYLLITAEKNGVISSSVRSIWSSYFYRQANGYEFVPTLDKPIYQPKETIQGRVLVWENNYLNATKVPAQFSQITIQLLSPQSTLLMQFERITDENGIVTFEVPLDESIETGTYKIVFKKDEFQQVIDVPIEYYEKPAYRVNINLDKEYIPSGGFASGNVSVQYYFGKPVTNAEIKLSLKDPEGNVLNSITGTSNAKGILKFKIPVSINSEEIYQLTLEATVTDPVGREVSSEASIITISNIYMWSWAYPWTPNIDDEINVAYYVYQGYYGYFDWGFWTPPKALENAKVRVIVKGINTGLFGTTANETIKEIVSDTNSYGYGKVSFQLDQKTVLNYEYFQILTILEIDDGRSASSQTRLEYAKYRTEFEFDKEFYAKGDTIGLTISVKDIANNPGKAKVRINLFDSDYDTIYRGILEITGTETINLKLTNYSPEGLYTIYSTLIYSVTNEFGSTGDKYVFGGYSFFKVGQQNQLQISTDKKEYSAGDSIIISGSLSDTSISTPIYYEISKRGVLFSGNLSLIGQEFELQLDNSEYLAPKITVLFVAFTSSGVIIESYVVISIKNELTLEITSDKDIYEPGEQFSVTIKLKNNNGDGVDGVAVVSFIDSSVFGVREDPEWEIEHFNQDNYWSLMSTTTNWRGFQPIYFYYWFGLGDVTFFSPTLAGAPERIADDSISFTAISGQENSVPTIDTSQIEIRDELPESMNWAPRVIIPANGYTFTNTLPDNIGEWTVRVTATKGQMGVLEKYSFVTQLPFFVELEKPATAMQDDIVTIKGIFYNYLSDDVKANVSITVDNSVILNRDTQSITIPKDYLTYVKWSVYVPDSGRHNITIYAQTELAGVINSDAIRKQIIVLANGVEEKFTSSGIIEDEGASFNLTSFPEAVSKRQFLVISKGLGDIILNSWERLIGYPYGCLEQTMSKLIPNVLIKNYLQIKGELTDTLENKLDNMIASGVTRIYSMQNYDGGFGWWSSDKSSNNYMTAYAVYGLNKAQEYGYPISDYSINRAVKFLQGEQLFDGRWETNYWRMDNFAFTAFVLRNLISLNSTSYSGLDSTISQGLQYLKSNWDSNSATVYTAGLILLATYNTSYWDASFSSTILDFIINNQKSDNSGIYWSVETQNYYWRPLGGTVETTAIIMQALTNIDYSSYNSLISSSLNWLLQEQKPWGWYNTKGTSEAISAIINLLTYVSSNNTGTVELKVNGNSINTFILDNETDIKPFDLSNYLNEGENSISLIGSLNSRFSYYVESVQNLRTTPVITFEEDIKVNPNQNVLLPVTITPISENVLIKDLKVSLLEEDWSNNSVLSIYQPILTSSTTFGFNLQSSGSLGIKIIKGIQIDYYLTNKDGSISSPGIISQIFGPVTIEIRNGNLNNEFLVGNNNKIITESSTITNKLNLPTIGFDLKKTYSKYSKISFGDFITVSMDLTSNKDDNNEFLLIEDLIPSGFIVDETSLINNKMDFSFTLTSTKTIFYFNSIQNGETISFTYRIQARENILSSIAPVASVASMYDEENKVYSSSYILGDNLVKKNSFGEIFRDLDLPNLLKYSYQTVKGDRISFSVDAEDNEGVSQVKVFYKNLDWSSQDLLKLSETSWQGDISDLTEREISIYIEIHDLTGNIYISKELIITLAVTVIIPVVLFAVFILTSAVGVGGYLAMKRKLWKL